MKRFFWIWILHACVFLPQQTQAQIDSSGFEVAIAYGWFAANPQTYIPEHGIQTGSGLRVSAGYKMRGRWSFTLAPALYITGSGMFDKREAELTQKVYRNFFMAEINYLVSEKGLLLATAGIGQGSYMSWNKPRPSSLPGFLPDPGVWNAADIAFTVGIATEVLRDRRLYFPFAVRFYTFNPGYMRFENFTTDHPARISLFTLECGLKFRAHI